MTEKGLFELERLSEILNGPVKSKPGRVKDIKLAKLSRVLRRAPEVLVKISSSGKSTRNVWAHLTYITRNGELSGENERGDTINGKGDVRELYDEWSIYGDQSEKALAKTVHIVLSMPEGTHPPSVLNAAKAFATEEFSANHQYLMVLHTDTPRPHAHISVKSQGYDLRALKRSKSDLQRWRETFARELRREGVDAEATPRRVRGVVKKAKHQAMYHLEKTPRRSRVVSDRVDVALRSAAGKKAAPTGPSADNAREITKKALARQKAVRGRYEAAATELRRQPGDVAASVASAIESFLKAMPPAETLAMQLERQAKRLIKGRSKPEISAAPDDRERD